MVVNSCDLQFWCLKYHLELDRRSYFSAPSGSIRASQNERPEVGLWQKNSFRKGWVVNSHFQDLKCFECNTDKAAKNLQQTLLINSELFHLTAWMIDQCWSSNFTGKGDAFWWLSGCDQPFFTAPKGIIGGRFQARRQLNQRHMWQFCAAASQLLRPWAGTRGHQRQMWPQAGSHAAHKGKARWGLDSQLQPEDGRGTFLSFCSPKSNILKYLLNLYMACIMPVCIYTITINYICYRNCTPATGIYSLSSSLGCGSFETERPCESIRTNSGQDADNMSCSKMWFLPKASFKQDPNMRNSQKLIQSFWKECLVCLSSFIIIYQN